MIRQNIEKICDRCWKPYVAHSATQRYDTKCSNLVYKENQKKNNKKMSEARRKRKLIFRWLESDPLE
jgi:phosphoglycerol transferase MdoB-like AlkP superfamily enzyme